MAARCCVCLLICVLNKVPYPARVDTRNNNLTLSPSFPPPLFLVQNQKYQGVK